MTVLRSFHFSQGASLYNEQLLRQNIDSFMVKVISEYPESSMSLFIFVSEVFKFLATPLKLVIEVDDIN